MYLGRFILGEMVTLLTLADADAGVRTQPAAPASFTVYDSLGARVLSGLMPALDRGRTAGLFRYELRLGSSYQVGRYLIRSSWDTPGGVRQITDCFDVVAGGAAGGLVVSHRYVTRPAGDAIVRKTDSGKRVIGRRPSP